MKISQTIKKAASGDEMACYDLFEGYHTIVFRYAAKFLDEDTAADIVQDTFIRAFKNLGSLSDPENFTKWLLRIARNLIYTHFAREKNETEKVREFKKFLDVNHESEMEQKQKRFVESAVRRVIESCEDVELRELARKYYIVGGKTTEELSKESGVPKGTVLARLVRFRKIVKSELCAALLDVKYELV